MSSRADLTPFLNPSVAWDTTCGPFHFFLAIDGAISHLYTRFQSGMVQGLLE